MSVVAVDEAEPFDAVYRDWLFARRLDNQKTSIRLHFLIKKHARQIGESERLVRTAMALVKAASSLWRPAYLSDRLGNHDDFDEDEFFLTDGVIQKDFVDDAVARAAPDWPFFLHMNNARDALIAVATFSDPPLIARNAFPAWVGVSYKACWLRYQLLLDQAVEAFETAIVAR